MYIAMGNHIYELTIYGYLALTPVFGINSTYGSQWLWTEFITFATINN